MTSQQTEEYIYKICSTKNWKIAKQIGVFKGFGIDLIDGYIHFSSKDQVKETARLHFNGEKELLLLKIETKNLEIKWEKSRNNQLFPHLYDELPLSEIVSVFELKLDENNNHLFSSYLDD